MPTCTCVFLFQNSTQKDLNALEKKKFFHEIAIIS